MMLRIQNLRSTCRHVALWTGIAVSSGVLATGCTTSEIEARSLLGERLNRPTFDADRLTALEQQRAEAQARYDLDPTDEEAIIWLGRRTAYLGRYREAIDIYSHGLDLLPQSHRLLRHRGHRFITTRQLDRAIADLARAAELASTRPNAIEPDGMPNPRNIPLTTTHGNIHYHLGLAHYLRGDFAQALSAYEVCATFGRFDDNLCSTSYWRYLILRRLGRHDEAATLLEAITEDMEIIENHAYHQLLLLYKGLRQPSDFGGVTADGAADIDDATAAYGVSMWHLLEGDEHRARSMWRELVEESTAWSAFGYIAAEAELARIAEQ